MVSLQYQDYVIKDGELIGDALGSAGGLKKIQDFQKFFRLNGRGENWTKTNNLLTNEHIRKEYRFIFFRLYC